METDMRKPGPTSAPGVLQFKDWAFESMLNAARSAAAESRAVRRSMSLGKPPDAPQDAVPPEIQSRPCAKGVHLAPKEGVSVPAPDFGHCFVDAGVNAWEVIGGKEKGGIVVRKGKGAFSSVESERLATGSVVEELALEGDRLHYRKRSGVGPESGWVRISFIPRDTKIPKNLLVRVSLQKEPSTDVSTEQDGMTDNLSPLGSEAVASSEEVDLVRQFMCADAGDCGLDEPDGDDCEVDTPVSLWHLLDASDPVARILGEGATQYRGALCDTADLSLFKVLRAELLRIERDQEVRTTWQQRGIWSSDGHKLRGHDFVLRRLTDLLNVEGLSWASNLYEDAAAACNFHHDGDKYGGGDSHNPGINPNITLVASFGATRDFTLRHADTGREFSFPQQNGDVIAFDKPVDAAFMHGLHPGDGKGNPRISVVIVGKFGGRSSSHLWAPRFQSNYPLWLPSSDRLPRLMQFSGIFVREAPHDFTQEELSFFAAQGSRVAIEYHRLLSKRFKTVAGRGWHSPHSELHSPHSQ